MVAPNGKRRLRRRRRGSCRASSASACAAAPRRAARRAIATGSRRSRPKVAARRRRCSLAARFAGCTARTRASIAYTRKLLGFTDNRQDAALQSGHFNDFLFVSLIRAGFLGALELAGDKGLRSDELGGRAAAGARLRSPDARDSRRVAARADAARASTCRRPRARCARCSPTASGSISGAAGATRTRTSSSSGSSRSTTSGSTSSLPTRSSSRRAHPVLRLRVADGPRGGLPRGVRSPAQVDGDSQPGARCHRRSSRCLRSRTAAFGRPGASASTRSREARAGS